MNLAGYKHALPSNSICIPQSLKHSGTLKLLYEDIISTIKDEGKEILTFGFSPFFNLQTRPFKGPIWSELALRFLFHFGNNLYQFKNLAFSKARCGLVGGGANFSNNRRGRRGDPTTPGE